MMNKLKKTLFLVFVFCPVILLEAKALKCDIPAPSAILINADTGAILYEKNARTPTFPASTTKIATALYALHKKGTNLSEAIKISNEAVGAVSASIRRTSGKHPSYRLEFGGSNMGLRLGEVLSLETLLYGLMVCSGNDAANAIAEYVSGNPLHFMEELNAFLKKIGCENTHFTNPHGLPDYRHITTAYDLARMTAVAMKNPVFCKIVKTTRYTKPRTNKQEESILVQSNALLKPGKYYYPYAIGVKTGYTVAAGRNIVAAAEKDGRRLIAVVLNCEEMAQRYRSCITLFEAAFNEPKVERKLFSQQHDFFTKSVQGAESTLEAILLNDVILEYYPSEDMKCSAQLSWNNLSLPVMAGQVVGSILIKDQLGKIVLTEPIYAKKDVHPTFSYKVSVLCAQGKNFLKHHKAWIGLGLGFSVVSLAYALRPRKKLVKQG